MNISQHMADLTRRQLDAEDDLSRAMTELDTIRLLIDNQATKEGLSHRDIQAIYDQMKDTR